MLLLLLLLLLLLMLSESNCSLLHLRKGPGHCSGIGVGHGLLGSGVGCRQEVGCRLLSKNIKSVKKGRRTTECENESE